MTLSNKIKKDIAEKKQQKYNNVEYFKEQILITDALKEDYDSAIRSVDADLISDIDFVNNTIVGVQSAYNARIVGACRTDMFWRVVGVNTAVMPADYSLIVTKLSVVGYGTTVLFVDSSGGITTYSADTIEIPGVEGDNLHAIKYYNQPYIKDIGDTTVGSFIGKVGFASTVLSVVSQSSSEIVESFSVCNLVISSKNNLFSGTNNKIVGFGTTTLSGISTTVMQEVVGIATTSLTVSTILLESATIGIASLPEADGTYVEFTVVTDPTTFQQANDRFKYQVKFTKNPFSPEEIGIMTTGTIGIGVSIEYDNSSNPPNTQTWKPQLEGTIKNGEKVKEPKVGAGRIYNIVGFSSQPTVFGVPQSEGYVYTTNSLIGLYTNISPPGGCTAIETNLTQAISARNSAESDLASATGCVNTKIDAANALRKERSDYSLKIWGLRQSIGGESDRIDDYEALENYIDLTENSIDGTTTCL